MSEQPRVESTIRQHDLLEATTRFEPVNSGFVLRLTRRHNERRRPESHRRIDVLQTSALPLGYAATLTAAGSLRMLSEVEAQTLALPLGYAATTST